MAANDVIRRLIVEAESRGVDDLAAKLRRVADAQGLVTRSAEATTMATERNARSVESATRAFERLEQRLVPAAKEQAELNRQLTTLQRAADQGRISQERLNSVLDAVKNSTRAGREELERRTRAEREAQAVAAARAQLTGAGRVEQVREMPVDRLAQSMHALRTQFEPLAVAQQVLAQREAEVNRALSIGIITRQQAAKATEHLRVQHERFARGLGQDQTANFLRKGSADYANLMFQFNDIVSGLAMGQSPMTVLLQQGGQVYQILAGSGKSVLAALRDVADVAVGLIRGPMGLLLGAGALVAGGIAAWSRYDASVREVRNSLDGLGRGGGQTLDSLIRVSERVAESFNVTGAQARAMTATLASTGRIGSDMMVALEGRAKDFASTTGQDLDDAVKQLGQAFADPVRGAEDLDKQLGFLDQRTKQFIASMMAQGRTAEAQRALFDALGASLGEHAQRTSIWERAFNALAAAMSRAADVAGRIISGPTETPEQERDRLRARRQFQPSALQRYQSPEQMRQERQDAERLEHLEELIRRTNQLADAQRRAADSRLLGNQGAAIAQTIVPEIMRAMELANEAKILERMLGDDAARQAANMSLQQVQDALGRIRAVLEETKREASLGAVLALQRENNFQERLIGLNEYQQGVERINRNYDEQMRAVEGIAKREEALNDERERALSLFERQQRIEAVRGQTPELQRFRQLTQQRDLIANAPGGVVEGATAQESAQALERLNNQIKYFANAAEQARREGDLEVRSILATTQAERTAIEAERERIRVLETTGDELEAAARAEAVRNRSMADAQKMIQDQTRELEDRRRLIGKTGWERDRIEVEIENRRIREQTNILDQPVVIAQKVTDAATTEASKAASRVAAEAATIAAIAAARAAAGQGGGTAFGVGGSGVGNMSWAGSMGRGVATGRYADTINAAGNRYGVDPRLLQEIARQESGFNPGAVGPMTRYGRAQGMFQLIPDTQRRLGVSNPFDPSQAADAAARHVAESIRRWGNNIPAILSDYNAGPRNTRRAMRDGQLNIGALPRETQNYISSISRRYATGGGATGAAVGGDTRAIEQSNKALEEQTRKRQEAQQATNDLTVAQRESNAETRLSVRQQERVADILNDANRSIEQQEQANIAAAAAWNATAGDIAYFNTKQEIANRLMKEAGLSFAEASQAAETYAQRAKAAADSSQALADAQERARSAVGLAKDFVKGVASDLMAGKSAAEAFTNALNRLAERLLDMALNAMFDSLLGGLGGGGGGGGGLFAGLPKLLMGGNRHQGGRIDWGPPWQLVDPRVFQNAERMHSGGMIGGGLHPNEVPIIGKRGEVVIPDTMTAAVHGGVAATPKVEINISTPKGTTTETKEGRTANGAPKIDVFVKEMAAQSAQPGQPLNRELRSSFGLRPALTRR